ncbi:MAG: hypothetical protein ABSE04_04310 [Candidatus Microgenomates bacterium]|jgi:hypothetical protein
MAIEVPIRNITFSFSDQIKDVEPEQTRDAAMGFWEYGAIAGHAESSEINWVPVDWMAWKLLVDVLGVSPERLK